MGTSTDVCVEDGHHVHSIGMRSPHCALVFVLFFVCFITYRRWGLSTSYNVAHPACGLKGSVYPSLSGPRLRVFIAMQVCDDVVDKR